MEFVATESGFEDGMGGASNAAGTADYHYVFFGRQADEQHPEFSGVYFEFDDQIHRAVDCITRVAIADELVRFELRDGKRIVVRRGMPEPQWSDLLRGIYDSFGDEILHKGLQIGRAEPPLVASVPRRAAIRGFLAGSPASRRRSLTSGVRHPER